MFSKALAIAGIASSFIPQVWAGFDSGKKDSIEIYWGQNSAGQAGSQKRLATYCANADIDIIPLAFLNVIVNPTTINFASATDNCHAITGSTLLSCPEIEEDIKTCQSTYGKTIMLSIGGATYTEGGFPSSSAAQAAADNIWALFGPTGKSSTRPFGTAVVDGFDFDFEASGQNMVAFGQRLRDNMNAATSKKFFLSAAPQCVFPDAAMGDMLNAIAFDFVGIQFYNNWCGVNNFKPGSATQNAFNFDVWQNWAQQTSKNKNVKLLLGIPANAGAAGQGYVTGSQLSSVISYSKQFSNFGGVMMWDMSQLYTNNGYLDAVVAAIGGSTTPVTPPTTTVKQPSAPTTAKPTTLVTVTRTPPAPTPTGTLVDQWGQCGGQDYTGPKTCKSPYSCACTSTWWCQCQ